MLIKPEFIRAQSTAPGGEIDQPCPNCLGRGLVRCFEARSVPVHSCLIFDSREEAASIGSGDIVLGFCPACGFIANTAFNAANSDYSPKYEETQHFSGRFSRFANALITRLVDEFGMRNRTILEVGCGKGEFLSLLCEAGDNRGIGIDPACIPQRLSESARQRVTLIQDVYREEHGQMQADVVMCRHTLEHIHHPHEFLAGIRKSLGTRRDVQVFFELPDVTRILREPAFWDVYYEHCSYFSPGSLARLFRACHFDVTHLWRDYDDQYLLIMAQPAEGPTAPAIPLEYDLDSTANDMLHFQTSVPEKKSYWGQFIAQRRQGGKQIACWGSGSKCVSLLTTLGMGDQIDQVIDINPHRHGKYMPGSGHRIISPDELAASPPDVVLVMNPIYDDEIRQSLADLGLSPEVTSVR